jgi:hypothetical protein
MAAWSTRRSLVSLGLLVLVLASCGDKTPQGSGTAKTEARNVGEFTDVVLKGPVTLDISVGSPGSFSVSADDDLLPDIETNVSKNTLTVDATGIEPVTPVRVVAVVASLQGIKTTGPSTVTGTSLGSASKMHIDINGTASVSLVGVGRATLVIDMVGAGRVDASSLPAKAADVEVKGAGTVQVNVEKSLKARLDGPGVVTYSGDPQVDAKVSGGGEVRRA